MSVQTAYFGAMLRTPSPVDSSRTTYTAVLGTTEISGQPPWNVDFGASWDVSGILSLSSSMEYQHWSQVSDGWSNLIQFHVSAAITPSSDVTLRTGFFR